ncbi:MAG: P1 family peptidase [Anaerolineales bacterium]|nr:P1 family peptidase [Anaerolineales bacterium]
MPRARDVGLVDSELPPGPLNALTDVSGVRVGHASLIAGDGPLIPGRGPVRTGVTVILPHGGNLFRQKVPAAVHTINGFGKVLGFEQVRELGTLEAPIALTNTLNVGLVADALVQYSLKHSPEIGITAGSVNVVVGETNDSYLNDLQGRHVRSEHVLTALASAAGGPVSEGNAGAGAGASALGWKGGLGTASRVLPPAAGGFILGALVQANFGRAAHLIVRGVPVGRWLRPPGPAAAVPTPPEPPPGSVMIVLATDAPLDARQLGRLCPRAAAGLARVGSVLDPGSGDFVIAFSTADTLAHAPEALTGQRLAVLDEPAVLSALFLAVVETVEEAVLNALCAAETMTGRDGHVRYALPVDQVTRLLRTLPNESVGLNKYPPAGTPYP